jgi:hypothetical protein
MSHFKTIVVLVIISYLLNRGCFLVGDDFDLWLKIMLPRHPHIYSWKSVSQQRNEDVARLLKKNVGARFVMKSLEILGIIN